MFCAGIGAAAVALLGSLFLALQGSPMSDTGADGGLLLGALLIGVSARRPLPDAHERAWEPSTAFGQVLPYVPVGLVIVVAAVAYRLGHSLDEVSFWAGLVWAGPCWAGSSSPCG